MNDPHVVNVSDRTEIFEGVWIGLLFVPVVVFYAYVLVWISNIVNIAEVLPLIKNVNEILGYGFGMVLLLGVQIASSKSKNDFIAGPIEELNHYTFFFIGMLMGGFERAFLFTILYVVLETYGMPGLVKSISANEQVKAISLGILPKKFVLYQYVYAPLASVVSMVFAHLIIVRFIPWAVIGSHPTLIAQIRSLSIYIALWITIESIFNSIYYKSLPGVGCMGLFLSAGLILSAFWLDAKNWQTWLMYGLLAFGGWIMTLNFIILSIQKARPLPGHEDVKYVNW